jgi:hypothetical protein
MRRTAFTAACAALLATAAFAVTAGESAPLATPQSLNLTPGSGDRVYPTALTGNLGEARGYRGEFTGTPGGKYRATCIWIGTQGENRLECTVIFRLTYGMLLAHGLVDPPQSPSLLSQTSTAGQLAITGGTSAYNGARGYVQVGPQFVTVHID